MSLERFKIAQADPDTGFEVALTELRNGRKVSHWIWYVFPQLRGLGRSPMAQFYALDDVGEARDYLRDALLGEHLLLAMTVVAEQLSKGVPMDTLMGSSVDSHKLVSCMTLFRLIAEESAENLANTDIRKIAGIIGLSPKIGELTINNTPTHTGKNLSLIIEAPNNIKPRAKLSPPNIKIGNKDDMSGPFISSKD